MKEWIQPGIIVFAAVLAACATHSARETPQKADPAPAAQAPAGQSAAKSAPAVAPPSEAAKGRRLWGVVMSVEPSTGKLAFKGSTGILHQVMLAAGAPLTKGGENSKITLDDVKPGDKITVHLEGTSVLDLHVNVTVSAK